MRVVEPDEEVGERPDGVVEADGRLHVLLGLAKAGLEVDPVE